MNEWLKGNVIPVLGVLLVMGGFLLTVYVKAEISSQLAAAGYVPKYAVDAVKQDVKDNKDSINTIESRWNNFIDQVAAQRIYD